jgi:hypothetical protein
MYGVRDDLDLSRFHGRELFQIRVLFGIDYFECEPEGIIGVEGRWILRTPDGTVTESRRGDLSGDASVLRGHWESSGRLAAIGGFDSRVGPQAPQKQADRREIAPLGFAGLPWARCTRSRHARRSVARPCSSRTRTRRQR